MLQKVKRILGIVLIAAFVFTFIYIGIVRITNSTPDFFGYSIIRVTHDSMEPEIKVGDVIIIKSVEPSTLEFGDVITYRGEKGNYKDSLVTSQISKEPYEKDGVYYFTTRGIKAGVVDEPEIDDSQIRGEVRYLIPYVGTIYDFFTEWYGILAFVVLLVLAFSSEIIEFLKRITKRDEIDEDALHNNIEDVRQSECIEGAREMEFETIITDLDDPDL